MTLQRWSQRIVLGLTGRTEKEWRSKIAEIETFGIETIALFLESYRASMRMKLYAALEVSGIRHLPLVHIKNDMTRAELRYLSNRWDRPCFTIHENSFRKLSAWKGFHRQLYLEMNYNDRIPKNVAVENIGGFCIDLSHFKAAEEKWSKEFEYELQRRQEKKLFKCNHLNGYSYRTNHDIHTVKSLHEFDYLKTLPGFIFGDVIAIETYNSLRDQIRFKPYILKLLQGRW